MWDEAVFVCAFCGRRNFIQIDPSAGFEQEYEEECQVCCQSNLINVQIDPETLEAEIRADMVVE